MRLTSRLFRRAEQCLAPETPAELIEQGIAAASTAAESIRHGSRGRTAATYVAVGATLAVATAAYVWWKRRDHAPVAVLERATAPVTPVPAASVTVVPSGVTNAPAAQPPRDAAGDAPTPGERPADVPTTHLATSDATGGAIPPAQLDLDGCEDHARRTTPQPSIVVSQPSASRPPSAVGRFAMPGVRGVVLPGGGRALP